MRALHPVLFSVVPFLTALGACGDDGDTTDTRSPDAVDSEVAVDSAEDAADAGDDAPDAADEVDDAAADAADAIEDSGPTIDTRDTTDTRDTVEDTVNPQADAWSSVWTTAVAGEARVLGLRYLGGQQGSAASLLALLDVEGDATLGDAALPGEGHRVVVASLEPLAGTVLSSEVHALAEGDALGPVTKAPNGFAVAITGAAPRVVLGQIFGQALRVASLAIEGAAVGLPVGDDVTLATTGGATTPLALTIVGATDHALVATVGDTRLEVALLSADGTPSGGDGVGFLSLVPPTADAPLPVEGSSLVLVSDLTAASVVETVSGPVVIATATATTAIRDSELAEGQSALVIGALAEATADGVEGDPAVPVILWKSNDAGTLDIVQVASAGFGGLALAAVATGEFTLGDATETFADPTPILTSLGSDASIMYRGAPCDELLGAATGFSIHVMKRTCDPDGAIGAAGLAMTVIAADFNGELTEPVDFLMMPLAADATATLLSGLVSFSVTDGRAYGGLFDFGKGPRLVLVRDDGQLYDSGVLPGLVGTAGPSLFIPLRLGGGGGGGGANPATNAVVYAVPTESGLALGRARIDLQTFIW